MSPKTFSLSYLLCVKETYSLFHNNLHGNCFLLVRDFYVYQNIYHFQVYRQQIIQVTNQTKCYQEFALETYRFTKMLQLPMMVEFFAFGS